MGRNTQFQRFYPKFSMPEIEALNKDEIERYTFLDYPISSRYIGKDKASYIDSSEIGDSLLRDIEKDMARLAAESFGIPSSAFGEPESSTVSAFKQAEPMHKETLMQWLKMLEEASKDFLERERGIGKGWICVMPLDIAQKLILAVTPNKINSWTMWDLQKITMRETWIAQTKTGGAEYCHPIYAYAKYYPRPYVEPKVKPYRRGKRDAVLLGQFQYE